jgi:hypothetical protein
MPRKIFISYRRQDAGANVLGIGQYLENEFGRKNVYIDVDMRAGTNFPIVLERRLADCKVMLVLIGPDWLNARDEKGQRRLDEPDDWVRIEIAHALRRGITVIPVRVNGAELPAKAILPEEIRGLLDYQAVSVSLAGFRNEMAGLVRDIRSISDPWPRRRVGAIAATIALLLAVFGLFKVAGLSNALGPIRPPSSSQGSAGTTPNGIWPGSPGQWVFYAFDTVPAAYYFEPSSIKVSGDRVLFRGRFPLKSAAQSGVYEDDINIVDCKNSTWATAERTIYSKAGEIMSHFNWGDPQTLETSIAINPGAIVALAQRIMCDEQIRTPLLSKQQLASTKFSYLSNAPKGDGEMFYGPAKVTADPEFTLDTLFIAKFFEDHNLTELLPQNNVLGLPTSGYRAIVAPEQLNCTDRKVKAAKEEYFDAEGNLVYLAVPMPAPSPLNATPGSNFDLLLNVHCGTKVQGTYEGTNSATYGNGGHGEQQISFVVEQTGTQVNVNFHSPNGSQGKGTGTLAGNSIEMMSLQSTTPDCPGSYEASLKFNGENVSWSYKGQDCGGPITGHGTAKKTRS